MKARNQILMAVLFGIAVGMVLNLFALPPQVSDLLNWIGKFFIRLLKMVTIPLIVASLIVGVTHLKTGEKLKAMGLRTFIFYMATTAISVTIGLILVNLFKPGKGVELVAEMSTEMPTLDRVPLGQMLLEFIPDNIFRALADMQFISIIIFSLIFGLVLQALKEKAKPIQDLFETLNIAMLKLVDWIMKIAPIGVFALMAGVVAKMGFSVFIYLGKYVGTVVVGLGLHGLIVLPLILFFFTRRSPLTHAKNMAPALSTAFSTSSSAATLPITIECAEKEAKVSPESAGFVLPLGATMNMDGTALYESVAAVFIAQVYGITLSFGDQLIIFLTATLASVGAAAVPSAGLVTMAIVLKAVGLPLEGIALVLGVDRLLDMCRTTVNVWGDSVGAVVVDTLMKKRGSAEKA